MNEDQLNYIYNFNSYKDEWRVVHRDNYYDLFNDDSKLTLKSKSISTLIEIVNKTKGNLKTLKLNKS